MLRVETTEGVYGPTLQGEGMNIGQMVTFVRFYGCEFRCTWCDTPFSLGKDKGGFFEDLTPEQVFERIKAIGIRNVVLSGGNPLIQHRDSFEYLLRLLKSEYYWIQVETQGSIRPTEHEWNLVDYWSISPKLPSAGEMESSNWKAVDTFINRVYKQVVYAKSPIDGVKHHVQMQFKFVIDPTNQYDYGILKSRLQDYGETFMAPIILQPEGLQLESEFDYQKYAKRLADLYALVAKDWEFWKYYTVRVLPQYHKIIWQKERRV